MSPFKLELAVMVERRVSDGDATSASGADAAKILDVNANDPHKPSPRFVAVLWSMLLNAQAHA